MRSGLRLFAAMLISVVSLIGILALVVLVVLKANETIARETADASEKRFEALLESWKSLPTDKPRGLSIVVFDDFETAGPRRIAGMNAGRALWRSFNKRLGVVQEPQISSRPDYVADYRAPTLMWTEDRARVLARVALLAQRAAGAGGRVHAVARGAPSARALIETLGRAGVRAGRFVALGARPEDLGDDAAIPAEDAVCAWIEGGWELRAQRRRPGGWEDIVVDFSAEPFEAAAELANPRPALIGGRWRGVYREDAGGPATAFDLFFAQEGSKLTGRIDEPDVFSGTPGKRLKPAIAGTISPEGVVRFTKTYDVGAPPSGPVDYEGRLNMLRTHVEGTWSVDGTTGPFVLEYTVIPKEEAMPEYLAAKQAEQEAAASHDRASAEKAERDRQAAEAAASRKAREAAAASDVLGRWTGTIKGPRGSLTAGMTLDKRGSDTMSQGQFTMPNVQIAVQANVPRAGSIALSFPSEGNAFSCSGRLLDSNERISAQCGFGRDKFALTLTRTSKR